MLNLFAVSNTCFARINATNLINTIIYTSSTKNGNLENMKWLKENRCSWNLNTFNSAVENGNLKNMKWLKENGCLWNLYTFDSAAENGNLENMKWLKANGCPT